MGKKQPVGPKTRAKSAGQDFTALRTDLNERRWERRRKRRKKVESGEEVERGEEMERGRRKRGSCRKNRKRLRGGRNRGSGGGGD